MITSVEAYLINF